MRFQVIPPGVFFPDPLGGVQPSYIICRTTKTMHREKMFVVVVVSATFVPHANQTIQVSKCTARKSCEVDMFARASTETTWTHHFVSSTRSYLDPITVQEETVVEECGCPNHTRLSGEDNDGLLGVYAGGGPVHVCIDKRKEGVQHDLAK